MGHGHSHGGTDEPAKSDKWSKIAALSEGIGSFVDALAIGTLFDTLTGLATEDGAFMALSPYALGFGGTVALALALGTTYSHLVLFTENQNSTENKCEHSHDKEAKEINTKAEGYVALKDEDQIADTQTHDAKAAETRLIIAATDEKNHEKETKEANTCAQDYVTLPIASDTQENEKGKHKDKHKHHSNLTFFQKAALAADWGAHALDSAGPIVIVANLLTKNSWSRAANASLQCGATLFGFYASYGNWRMCRNTVEKRNEKQENQRKMAR